MKYIIILLLFCVSNIIHSQDLLNKKEVKRDINYLTKILTNVFPEINKNDVIFSMSNLIDSIRYPINKKDFYLAITPVFNALTKDGHSQIGIPIFKNKKDFLYFPIKLIRVEDKIYVKETYDNILKATEVISINNIPIENIINKLLPYINGEESIFKKEVLIKQNTTFSLLLNIVYPQWTKLNINFKDQYNNQLLKYSINTKYQTNNNENFKKNYIFKIINNNGYLKINELIKGKEMECFIDSIFYLLNNNSYNLIIDLRDCGGGNSRGGDYILKYISKEPFCQFSEIYLNNNRLAKKTFKKEWPFYYKLLPISVLYHYDNKTNTYVVGKKSNSIIYPKDSIYQFSNKLFVITSKYTYSSAISFARTIKDYSLGKIIGTETVTANLKGPSENFKLPSSNLKFSVSYIHQIRPSGITNGRGVIPDYKIKEEIEDFRNNKDTMIETLLKNCYFSQ